MGSTHTQKTERKKGYERTRRKEKYHHERNQYGYVIQYILDEWRNKYMAYQCHNGYRDVAVWCE